MKHFRPSLWSSIALVSVGCGLCSLGFWQVDRWREMHATKQAYDARVRLAPQVVRQAQGLDTLAEWRRVELIGRYTGEQVRVINKYIDGQLGVWLAAVMVLADASHVVVMRGWVPDDAKRWPPPSGQQRITGILRRGSGDLAAQLTKDEFRSLDAHATLTAFGHTRGFGRILIQGELVPAGGAFSADLPRRGFYDFRIRRPHREYAGTWFGLAIALFLLWLYAGLRRGANGEQR